MEGDEGNRRVSLYFSSRSIQHLKDYGSFEFPVLPLFHVIAKQWNMDPSLSLLSLSIQVPLPKDSAT